MLIFLLLTSSPFEIPPKKLAAELKQIRDGKDERAKNTRIVAYGYIACAYAHRFVQYDTEATSMQMRRVDPKLVEVQHDKANKARDIMSRAEKLAMRDTRTGISCEGESYLALGDCLAHLMDPEVGQCVDRDGYLAMSLALADFPELNGGGK